VQPAARDRSLAFFVVATWALTVLTTGPLYRVRTWWDYDDPLATDPVVIGVYAVTGVAAVAWLVVRRALPRTPAVVAAGLVVAWLLVSTLWSTAWATTVREALQLASVLAVGIAALVGLGVRRFAAALWVALHVGLVWSFIAIQVGEPGTQDERGDWAGVFFNRNSLALIAALGLVIGAAILVDAWVERSRPLIADAVVAVMVVVDVRLLLGSAARTPWVALGAAVVLAGAVVVASPLVQHGRSARLLAGGGAVVLVVAGAVAWGTRHRWLDDLGRSGDLTGRVDVWDVAVERWRDRPVVGHGYLAEWQDAAFVAEVEAASGHLLTSAHNAFVEVLLGGGVVGLVLLVVFVGVLWVQTVGAALERPSIAGLTMVALLVFVLAENLTETLFVGNHITVALLGALAAATPSVGRALP
jgi:O-antigen ligase